ncbi:MAG TPA: endolytic transglycosylase MltG [Terriglobales bacterium]|nr:endolytic transglycosylase MltG [Terriglobales bacterium]
MRFLLKLVFVALIVVSAWLAWAILVPTQPAETTFVMLKPGWSTRRIASELQSRGVIRSWRAFLLYHYVLKPRTLKAGEYKFEGPENNLLVHTRLVRGDIYVHTVVVPEGFNVFDIASAVEAAGLGRKEDFLAQTEKQVSLIRDLDPEAKTLEGYLFPDTYGFTRTQSMQDIVAAMVHRFKQEANSIGLNSDVHRTVTLASIVEKETAAPEERPLVAGVYLNRLQKRMALDADPSVIYASLLAGHYQGIIYQSDLHLDSAYNTYKNAGLPPGPIANPGKASLLAAMNPTRSDYLYFVSDNNGHHRFARTLDEHSRNVALYRRAVAAAAK